MVKYFDDIKRKTVLDVAYQMMISAKTAPKGLGQDSIILAIVSDEEKEKIAKQMHQLADIAGKNFHRDAKGVEQALAVLLFGIKNTDITGGNCGSCGFATCDEFLKQEKKGMPFPGPFCDLKLIDLGIAIGSAVKTAALIGVDNRVMYRIGVAAKLLNLMDADYILGIPLSATSKNIFFDR
ncbi:MAG: ferredoxin domain-containing protein [Candidatus Jordarchaeum sp.]|uniref:ferredoxin domain-containing protein n=1 Tax=Candidatus Jordarchaeum sp. TaxID=2823881 RepID=UPI004049D7CC